MDRFTKVLRGTGGGFILSLFITCAVLGAEGPLYLKNNIHAQQGRRDIKASYANWTNPGAGHILIPLNTKVRFKKGGHIRSSIFTMILLDSGKKVYFEFDKKRMAMEPEEYWKLIASPTKVDLSGLSEIDLKGIREGKVYKGMTKDGVRMALGYPAAHRTPSLDSNEWVYWTNRFRSFIVVFDAQGRVIAGAPSP